MVERRVIISTCRGGSRKPGRQWAVRDIGIGSRRSGTSERWSRWRRSRERPRRPSTRRRRSCPRRWTPRQQRTAERIAPSGSCTRTGPKAGNPHKDRSQHSILPILISSSTFSRFYRNCWICWNCGRLSDRWPLILLILVMMVWLGSGLSPRRVLPCTCDPDCFPVGISNSWAPMATGIQIPGTLCNKSLKFVNIDYLLNNYFRKLFNYCLRFFVIKHLKILNQWKQHFKKIIE